MNSTDTDTQLQRDASQSPSHWRWHGLLGWPLAGLLLALHFVLAVSAVSDKCSTFDEIAHLTGGYSYWVTGDYRLNPEGGMLGQRLMALPLLAGDHKFPPTDQDVWRDAQMWRLGDQFFHRLGNDLDAMLTRTRVMMALISVALGAAVYAISRRLFGKAGAAISLSLIHI